MRPLLPGTACASTFLPWISPRSMLLQWRFAKGRAFVIVIPYACLEMAPAGGDLYRGVLGPDDRQSQSRLRRARHAFALDFLAGCAGPRDEVVSQQPHRKRLSALRLDDL